MRLDASVRVGDRPLARAPGRAAAAGPLDVIPVLQVLGHRQVLPEVTPGTRRDNATREDDLWLERSARSAGRFWRWLRGAHRDRRRKAIEAGWRKTKHDDPPKNPAAPGTEWSEALCGPRCPVSRSLRAPGRGPRCRGDLEVPDRQAPARHRGRRHHLTAARPAPPGRSPVPAARCLARAGLREPTERDCVLVPVRGRPPQGRSRTAGRRRPDDLDGRPVRVDGEDLHAGRGGTARCPPP